MIKHVYRGIDNVCAYALEESCGYVNVCTRVSKIQLRMRNDLKEKWDGVLNDIQNRTDVRRASTSKGSQTPRQGNLAAGFSDDGQLLTKDRFPCYVKR